eukprot:346539-Chlamydomonas_euryale.AAC.4
MSAGAASPSSRWLRPARSTSPRCEGCIRWIGEGTPSRRCPPFPRFGPKISATSLFQLCRSVFAACTAADGWRARARRAGWPTRSISPPRRPASRALKTRPCSRTSRAARAT